MVKKVKLLYDPTEESINQVMSDLDLPIVDVKIAYGMGETTDCLAVLIIYEDGYAYTRGNP
jgi:hypothetical protein